MQHDCCLCKRRNEIDIRGDREAGRTPHEDEDKIAVMS